jgi:hypothetical protein
VGFDPNCALRGYQSAREQAELTECLLAAARQAPSIVLVVKPHPAYPIDHLSSLFAAAPTNVIVLPRQSPLSHFLNAMDLMVSKYSTLLLEAALMRRIAMPVILDGDMRFRVFGDLAPVITEPSILTGLLVRLASEPMFRTTWMTENLHRQESHLQRNYLPQPGPNPAARAAAAILAHGERHAGRRLI